MKKLEDLLKTQTDQRLLRLFAVGCCRQIWDLLKNEKSKTAVEVAERFADGQATRKELNKANAAAYTGICTSAQWAAYYAARDAANYAVNAEGYYAAYAAANYAASYAAYATTDAAANAEARERQLELYHCLFTKIVFTTTSQNALTLATIIHLERNWALMPILGDALEESGAITEVVSHCKEKEHARGCWVIDNLLGHRK